MVIIEVTHTAGLKKDCIKVQNLMNDYDVPEGFVYDYKKSVWYKISTKSREPIYESFSAILNADLSKFLVKT